MIVHLSSDIVPSCSGNYFIESLGLLIFSTLSLSYNVAEALAINSLSAESTNVNTVWPLLPRGSSVVDFLISPR